MGEGHVDDVCVFTDLQGILEDTEKSTLVWGWWLVVCVEQEKEEERKRGVGEGEGEREG